MYSTAHNAFIIVLFVVVAGCIFWVKRHKAKAAELEARAKAEFEALEKKWKDAVTKSGPSK